MSAHYDAFLTLYMYIALRQLHDYSISSETPVSHNDNVRNVQIICSYRSVTHLFDCR